MKSDPKYMPRQTGGELVVDGKFFRRGGERFLMKGITYGPFAPDQDGGTFGSPHQVEKDLDLIVELGANLLRVYDPPPFWFLDMVQARGLGILVDLPWPKHLCIFDSKVRRMQVREEVKSRLAALEGHPAVVACSIANEIPADIVRFSGQKRVREFVEGLIQMGRALHPTCLFTYANYPSTEFLQPENVDFVSFNIYLHDTRAFRAYLARLQMIADTKPLVISELGMDSLRNSRDEVERFFTDQLRHAFGDGVAGAFIFSFTDDWFRGGQQVEDWAFGMTDIQRQKKPVFDIVKNGFSTAPDFSDVALPKVSVVVASYNGGRTLRSCLTSLRELSYPDYEVILVDDGSTDDTPSIVKDFPWVRAIRQENKGLSCARNAGIAAAHGEIVAFTDSDCRVDRFWLRYMVRDLVRGGLEGIGGHNLLPPEDSPLASAVMASPGGPAHVMLTDVEAEHIPGCNMAFYKSVLEEVGGFDPIFRKAGDDVDICWRLQQRGYRLGFSPGGFVWHYRRSTLRAYLRQQAGYGEAEALLAKKHPECFNRIGNGIWRGRIYQSGHHFPLFQQSVIYHGVFGSSPFQKEYAPPFSSLLLFALTLEYWCLIVIPALVWSVWNSSAWFIAAPALLLPLLLASQSALTAIIPVDRKRSWSRPLIALLNLLQPLSRGWARYRMRFKLTPSGRAPNLSMEGLPAMDIRESNAKWVYWSGRWFDRYEVIKAVAKDSADRGFHVRQDTGWHTYDLELIGDVWSRFYLTTTTEELDRGSMNMLFKIKMIWSPVAHVVFWGAVILLALAIWLLAPVQPWVWMLPAGLPVLLWFLETMHLQVASTIGALVHEVASIQGLHLVEPIPPESRYRNFQPADPSAASLA